MAVFCYRQLMNPGRLTALMLAAFVGLCGQRAEAIRAALPDLTPAPFSAVPPLVETHVAACEPASADAWHIEAVYPIGQAPDGDFIDIAVLVWPGTHTRVWCYVKSPLGLAPTWHHELVQSPEMRAWFKRAGLHIDEARFGRMFNTGAHKYDKLHRAWNSTWRAFKRANPNATKQMILRQLARMRKMKQFRPLYQASSRAVVSYTRWGQILARRGRMLRAARAARMANATRGLRLSRAAKFTIISILASEVMMQFADARGEAMYERAEDHVDRLLDTRISMPMIAHQVGENRWVLGAPRGFSSTLNRDRMNGIGIESAEWIVVESEDRPIIHAMNVFADFETPIGRAALENAQSVNEGFNADSTQFYGPEDLPEDVRNAITQ